MKTLLEKDEMSVTSIFSFSNNVLYPSKNTNLNCLVTFILSSANAFNLDKLKMLLFDVGLNLYKIIHVLTLSQTSPGFYMSTVDVF